MFSIGNTEQDGLLRSAECAFSLGDFQGVVELLQGQASDGRSLTLLGVALRKTGQLAEAAYPLWQAAVLGDEEGLVEYGNQLRLLGQLEEAVQHFQESEAQVSRPELRARLQRWWGVTEFQLGRSDEGLSRVEGAWKAFVALRDTLMTAQVAQSLAQMYAVLGHDARARTLLKEALLGLPERPDPAPRLAALKNLMDLQLRAGELSEARSTLDEAKRFLHGGAAPRLAAHFACSEAELSRLMGQQHAYHTALESARRLAETLDDHQLRIWVTSRAAEQASLQERHARAVSILHGVPLPQEQWPPELWATDGILRRRRGDITGALDSLGRAAARYRAEGAEPELARTLLHLAASSLAARDHQAVAEQLSEALAILLRLKYVHAFSVDVEELDELLKHALLDPDLAPYTSGLLERLALLTGGAGGAEEATTHLQLRTLGRMQVIHAGQAVHFTYARTPLLLAYLTLSPGRTTAQMQLDLFPDEDGKSSRRYLRQLIWDARDKLGHQVLVSEGAYHAPAYRTGPGVRVSLDYRELLSALDQGEIVRAFALYRGPFAPDDDSPWVTEHRERALLSLSFEVKNHLADARARGDYRRVVLYANQLLAADPYDLEVLEARVEAAQVVSSPLDLAQYTAALNHAQYN